MDKVQQWIRRQDEIKTFKTTSRGWSSSESPSPPKRSKHAKKDYKTTIDIDVRLSEEMNESIQSTKLLLWYGDRRIWRFIHPDKTETEPKIREITGEIDIPQNSIVEGMRHSIKALTTDVLNCLEWNDEKNQWNSKTEQINLTTEQHVVFKGFIGHFGNSPGRNCWQNIFVKLLFQGMFNHNIGGSSPMNTIQRQLGVTVQCYDADISDSEKSIDVRDEPLYYCPTSDVLVCDRNDQVFLDISIKPRNAIEKQDFDQLIVELLSLLPTQGSGSLPGILTCSTHAYLFMAVKDVTKGTVIVTKGSRMYNYKETKSDFFS